MKKKLLLLVLMLLLAAGCGKQKEASEPLPAPTDTSISSEESEAPKAALTNADFEAFSVKFSGAESFTDADGDKAIRIFYDFTNHSDEPCEPESFLIAEAKQNESPLEKARVTAADGYDRSASQILKDVTKRCLLEYKLLDGSPVTVTLDDYDSHALQAVFLPEALVGAPDALEQITVDAPTLPEGISESADLFGLYHVELSGHANAAEHSLRVYISFENVNDEAEAALGNYCIPFAYQDGVELSLRNDENLFETITQGKAITCILDYTLNSDSPVEINLCEFNARTPLAGLIVPVE